MTQRTYASQARRFILVMTALFLPTLTLIPLGGLYLYEKGVLLWWAVAATALVAIVYASQKRLFTQPEIVNSGGTPLDEFTSQISPSWNPMEEKAWADVRQIAKTVEIEKLIDADALLELAQRTINVVAKRLHPERSDALWRFTMPEAFAITERVSRKLSNFVQDNVPFGDRLTIAQVLQIYSWRSFADAAGRAYDVWRLVRLSNPVTAVTHEARERLSRAMMQWGRDHISRRLTETFVEEVGRAAIDLYGGRLKLTHEQFVDHSANIRASDTSTTFPDTPLRVVVIGSQGPSRDAANTMLQEMQRKQSAAITAFLRGEQVAADTLRVFAIDVVSAPISDDTDRGAKKRSRLTKYADIVVYTVSHTGLSETDRDTLREVAREAFVVPPVLLPVLLRSVASEIQTKDRASSRSALEDMTATRLGNHYTGQIADSVELLIAPHHANDNETRLWDALTKCSTQARRVQFLRRLQQIKSQRNWTGTAKQAISAVGSVAKSILPRWRSGAK